MNYFCPFCQKKHPESQLTIAIDVDNRLLKKMMLNLTEDKKASESNYQYLINTLVETAERELSGVGFIVADQKQLIGLRDAKELSVTVTVDDVINALESALEAIKRAREINEDIIDAGVFKEICEFIEKLFTSDYEEIEETIWFTNLQFDSDINGNSVLIEARGNSGVLPKVCGESGCHRPVYKYAGLYDEVVIGLLGSQRVAKSTCIASTLYGFHYSREGCGIYNDVTFELPPDTDSNWNKNFNIPVYLRYLSNFSVTKTQIGLAGSSFIVTVKVSLPRSSNGGSPENLVLTFIDMPGEYINSKKDDGLDTRWFSAYKNLFSHADAFWFCIDEGQLYQLENENHLRYLGYGNQNTTAVQDYRNHIVDFAKLKANLETIRSNMTESVFPPTAIILTKSDSFSQSFNAQDIPAFIFKSGVAFAGETQVYNTEKHCLILKSIVEQSRQIKTAFSKNASPLYATGSIINMLNDVFANKAFFSTSAYSNAPQEISEETRNLYASILEEEADETERVQKIKDLLKNAGGTTPTPFKPRLPLYWTLAVLGKLEVYVKSKKTARRRLFSQPPEEFVENIFLLIDQEMTSHDENGQSFVAFDKLCMH